MGNTIEQDQKQVYQPWTNQYYEALNAKGWRFLTHVPEGKINSNLIASHDTQTIDHLKTWQEKQDPVEISVVIVMPNTDVTSLPARVIGYVATALRLSSSLQKVSNVNIDTLRVMSPCYSNVYTNGGDIDIQLSNAQRMRQFIEAYKKAYYPELESMQVTLDTGNPITQEIEEYLLPRVQNIQTNHPAIADGLVEVAQRYNKNGAVHHLMDESQRPLVYLLTHPPAWGYSQEEQLFVKNGYRRINFMPSSELRYLMLMRTIEGDGWLPAQDKEIATVISAKQTHAPYHSIVITERFGGNEPSIEDLTIPGALQVYGDRFRPYTGRIEVAEVIANLNQIKFDTESANSRRKRLGLGSALTLAELLSYFG